MSKSKKQVRALDEKHHHLYKAIKRNSEVKAIKQIDRAIRNKQYECVTDEGGIWPEGNFEDIGASDFIKP